jgi:glycerol-3-phosphate dehydrogenase (NAD(P)+)
VSSLSQCVAIVGDGQMGLVLADALSTWPEVEVRLWGPFAEPLAELDHTRASPDRLPGFRLPESVRVLGDQAELVDGATLLVNAIPTQFIRSVWSKLGRLAAPETPVVCVSKGFEMETYLTPTGVIEAARGPGPASLCALSGPTIARELAERRPATMVAASADSTLAEQVQSLFSVPWLRVYRHDDMVGVEVAGATKNVIALAAGMVDGLGLGYNAKSALLARGLAEIARLGAVLGARVDTFFGVAGVGDLATTCFCPHGRNRTCGERLGRGERLDDILQSMVSVVEGVPTTRAVHDLAQRHDVQMPIAAAVYRILFEGLSATDAIASLMQREPKAERIG